MTIDVITESYPIDPNLAETLQVGKERAANNASMADTLVKFLKENPLFENSTVVREVPENLPAGDFVTVVILAGPFVIMNIIDLAGTKDVMIDVYVNPLNDACAVGYLVAELFRLFPDTAIRVVGPAAPIVDQNVISYVPDVVYAEFDRIMRYVSNAINQTAIPSPAEVNNPSDDDVSGD